ncbi:MAG: tRNA (N6-threonylcarbamoyladenosine(37)-N6)-methyltransferase TrmO [Clostridia bacterium]|nr:tRNA (N6-threonylcarbamoyladenosine(37)-N6)-methyltransferase TrmO [Clostridia bacterium]
MDERIIKPVGYIYTDFTDKFGIPRQSGRVPSAKGRVVLSKEYGVESVRGLNGVSHIWLLFGFSAAEYTGARTVRPPRLGGNVRVGVFASRSPNRPNGIGLSCVKLESVERADGATILNVCGADLLSGTPVYDIKPYNPADRIENAKCGFSDGFFEYRLKVEIPDRIKSVLPAELVAPLTECLSDDPRPSYQGDGRVYGMIYGGYNVKFKAEGQTVFVLSAEKV